MLAVESVIERLKKYLNVTTDAQLARLLGISAVTLSAWRYRNVFDIMKVYPLCPDVNWNWLFNGEGEMRYDAKKNDELKSQVEYLLHKVNELESQNKILFKLLEKFVSREEIEKLGPMAGERPREDEIAWIKPVDKTVSVPYLKETPEKAPEVKKEPNKL
jgi:hypothetical protein